MEYLKKYGIVTLLIFSLIMNLAGSFKLSDANAKIKESNRLVSLQVEQSIRQSMSFTKKFREDQSMESLQHLQQAVQDLARAFQHWEDINQTEWKPNKPMEEGVKGIESLRNLVALHLNTQYINNDYQLQEYDIEVLDKIFDSLNQLLAVYHNIRDGVAELRYDSEPDGGLIQVANDIKEITRLYRHSIIPNKHSEYIPYHEALKIANEQFLHLTDNHLINPVEDLLIKDGVHSYQFKYKYKKEIYILLVDAINGELRSIEIDEKPHKNYNITEMDAIYIAQEYLSKFYSGEVEAEVFAMEEENNRIYAFRFIPIIDNIKMVSDVITVNVASATGEVEKFSNDFLGSEIPAYSVNYQVSEIIKNNENAFVYLEYEGLSLVRSFQTRYQPRVTFSFKTNKDDQEMIVYFDVETGKQLQQIYYFYETLQQ